MGDVSELPRIRCPTCGKPVAAEGDPRPASFPFCSSRCKLLDLGAWFDGRHAIPGGQPEYGEESGS
jgi:endogenous inhibitor of DNA gyrase (YacG/DUF329 family)